MAIRCFMYKAQASIHRLGPVLRNIALQYSDWLQACRPGAWLISTTTNGQLRAASSCLILTFAFACRRSRPDPCVKAHCSLSKRWQA